MRLFEAASAAATGQLDEAGFSKNMLALFGALLGIMTLLFWDTYYFLSLGAAQPKFNNYYHFDISCKVKGGSFVKDDDDEGKEIEMVEEETRTKLHLEKDSP
jgi:hypothetical protein